MPNRIINACDRCRKSKRGCDRRRPACSRCLKANAQCIYPNNDQQLNLKGSWDSFSVTPLAFPSSPIISVEFETRCINPVLLLAADCVCGVPNMKSEPASAPLSPTHYELPNFPAQPDRTVGLPSPGFSSISPEPVARDVALHPIRYTPMPASPGSSSTDHKDLSSDQQVFADARSSSTPAGTVSARAASSKPARKRKRTCLSCRRCHHLKVRCDKELPCGRCVSSDKAGDCYYNYNKGIHSGRFASTEPPPDLPHNDPKAMMAHWKIHHQSRGSSHWRELMVKISEIAGPEKSAPLNTVLQNIATNACLSNFSLPGNFPFGTPGSAKYLARDVVSKLINDETENVSLYIETYLELLDTVNPVIDIPSFQAELKRYSESPSETSLCWLAQFLMVLGLGSFVSADPEPVVATEFMLAAEACLMQTPFMFRPTLASLKALTLMVVAKQVCNATCWSVDSAFSLLGTLVRAAYTFGLPQDKDELELVEEERRDRRHLWLTIQYIDAKVAISSGMPPVTQMEALRASMAIDPDLDPPDSMHDVLRQAFPTIMCITSRMNSEGNEVTYSDVLEHSARIRTLIAHAARVCSSDLQFSIFDIFLRRCLMVLHRPFAMHEDGPTLYAESYWASLECSLAVLRHYREIYAGDEDTPPGYPLLGRANVLDFFSATLTVLLSVMRRERPLTDENMGETVGQIGIPPRQLILNTVRSCIILWEKEKDRSVCYRTTYDILVEIDKMLPET